MELEKIGVIARIRPLLPKEGTEMAVECRKNGCSCTVTINDKAQTFTLNNVYPPSTTQAQFFLGWISATVDHFVDGLSAAVIAYGQTSSGKTYTMTGTKQDPGVISRSVRRIFENNIGVLRCTFVEIYNDKVFDLLNTRSPVKINGDGSLKDAVSKSATSLLEVQQLIDVGDRLKSVGTTKMNSSSSRSHSVLQLRREGGAEISFVDLAGSETVKKSGASGNTLNEAKFINSSLSVLSRVIKELSENSDHISFRDSKLTQILRPSLDGDIRTTVIVNCSPSLIHASETINTLRFGESAKKVTFQESDLESFNRLEGAYNDYFKLHLYYNNLVLHKKHDLELLRELDKNNYITEKLEKLHVEPINRKECFKNLIEQKTLESVELKQVQEELQCKKKELEDAEMENSRVNSYISKRHECFRRKYKHQKLELN